MLNLNTFTFSILLFVLHKVQQKCGSQEFQPFLLFRVKEFGLGLYCECVCVCVCVEAHMTSYTISCFVCICLDVCVFMCVVWLCVRVFVCVFWSVYFLQEGSGH